MNSNWIACLSLFSLPFLYAPEAAAKPPAESPKDAVHEAAAAPDNPLLAKMKTLVGSWKSSMGQMSTTTTYKTTGGGKCVAETVALGPHKEMLTMYCADGDALVATHYCDSGNQPRMRADKLSADGNTIDFQFKDITNLPAPDAPHMATVKFTWKGDKSVLQEWGSVGKKGAAEAPTVFTLTKTK